MAKAKHDKRDRFEIYLDKTYNKTASLMANACKAVTVLTKNSARERSLNGHQNLLNEGFDPTSDAIPESAFSYGRNIGIAFQLIDDWLDFSSSAELLGKPAAADMK